jgi:predicted transcriptional regulator
MKIDIELATTEYKAEFLKMVEEYGNASDVPADDQRLLSEKLRASYAIHANPDTPIHQVLKTYSIDSRVWGDFVDDAEDMKKERKLSRKEKHASVLTWASHHVGEKIELTKLMDTCGIAYSMAKKITEDHPDVFRKVKRGHFEIRDPKADREAEKQEIAKAAESEASKGSAE